MNILVPDTWLREFLKTKASPQQLKDYLSLCGPSVERLHKKGNEYIYDIEVTGNRPDSMSISGIAREAAAILPRFSIPATFLNDPYAIKKSIQTNTHYSLKIKTDPKLNPRWTSIILSNVSVGSSPSWIVKRLEQTAVRSINSVIDISNYLMRAYGQPVHMFDYDEIKEHEMRLRESRKGEKIVTLDGKTHILPGSDLVIEDGGGRLIDLCGIMGGYNSSIKNTTKNVVLFVQSYDPMHIRKTSMSVGIRTEASSLFEKKLDPDLTLPVLIKGVEMLTQLTGAKVAGKLLDIYPNPYKPKKVTLTKNKMVSYIGNDIGHIEQLIKPLGLLLKSSKFDITVTVPSWRRDIKLDVDIIEEIARIYGYHNIENELPASPPPIVIPSAQLSWEQEIKVRLRDWGYTELYGYSMISEKLMDIFGFDKHKSYKISNPLSDDWVYMRPSIIPGVLSVIKNNLKHTKDLACFELSMVYEFRKKDIPLEVPTLLVVMTGQKSRELKGLAEALSMQGVISQVDETVLEKIGIDIPITLWEAPVVIPHKTQQYIPIPKYPPIIEDFSFLVTPEFQVGPFIETLLKIHTLIKSVSLLDVYPDKRTFRVMYQDATKTLTNLDVAPVHQKILEYAAEKFGISPVI